ncbi:MAG: hypothetical protein JNL74_03210 [Fibrobacteres bacterium]|nr:hypothetical protein [Fibrobacterota bacterium]
MEINIDISIRSSSTLTSVSSQTGRFREFAATLEHIQMKICSLGKSKIEGKSLTDGVRDFGIVGYAKELRIDELRVRIRESVLYDLGTTPKKFGGLKSGIEQLHSEWMYEHDRIDKLVVKFDFLEAEIEIEVERRLQEHLSAEALSGELIVNTLAYSSVSVEYQSSLANIKNVFTEFADCCRELIKGLVSDAAETIRKCMT